MKHYGLPYQGSKDKIALAIHEQLPSGKRFVDLFGGGFAMSHAALLIRGKYERVLYNELNPLLCELIKKAIAGEYNYDTFRPEFITREKFNELKDRDGYVRYIWSFGNSGTSYLFGEDVEDIKHKGHDYVIFGKPIEGVDLPVLGNSRMRRLALRRWAGERAEELVKKDPRLSKRQAEARYELQQLERLERLQQLERLEIRCGDYRTYTHENGDVVYCDPPYEGTAGYNKTGFDHKGFYDWVASRDYPVFFSSYKISDKRFKLVWAKQLRGLAGGANGAVYNFECLYTNG